MIKNLVLISMMITGFLWAKELSVNEIIKNIDNTEQVKSSISSGKQIIITSSGKKRTLGMKTFSKDKGDKQLLIYTAPARVKGDKILMLNGGDDIWFYTPKTDRVRHLASHAKKRKIQGSNFSYEDINGGTLEKNYNYKLLGTEKINHIECYKLQLIPKPSGPHYSKLILWADKEKFITMQIDYYENDEILKRLSMSNIQNKNGHWIALKMVMKNLSGSGETVMEISDIKFDVDIDDSVFTTNNLKRH